MEIHPSEELAYWTGVAQSDGYLKKHIDRNEHVRFYMVVRIAKKSLIMLHKFRKISKKLFNREAKIWKGTQGKFRYWIFKIGIKNFLGEFKKLDIKFSDPPIPPSWCVNNFRFFGAYLAGLIDGDGDVRIHRPKYPQCAIRISGGRSQDELKDVLERVMKCSVHITYVKEKIIDGKKIHGHNYALEFYVSPKNNQFIEDFVLKHVVALHKKRKINLFVNYLKRDRTNFPTY